MVTGSGNAEQLLASQLFQVNHVRKFMTILTQDNSVNEMKPQFLVHV